MKEIKAVIQPFVVDHVVSALRQIPNLPGITVSEVKGFGRTAEADSSPGSATAELFGGRRTKIEIVVPDELVRMVTEVIVRHAHTGNPGDGKVFVYRVEEVIRIRTGEAVTDVD